jgi:predicted transcriptional regulator
MTDSKLANIENKLGILTKLIALQLVKDMTNKEAAPLLNKIGMTSTEIAEILGSTSSAIRNYISEAKKK